MHEAKLQQQAKMPGLLLTWKREVPILGIFHCFWTWFSSDNVFHRRNMILQVNKVFPKSSKPCNTILCTALQTSAFRFILHNLTLQHDCLHLVARYGYIHLNKSYSKLHHHMFTFLCQHLQYIKKNPIQPLLSNTHCISSVYDMIQPCPQLISLTNVW